MNVHNPLFPSQSTFPPAANTRLLVLTSVYGEWVALSGLSFTNFIQGRVEGNSLDNE